MLKLIYLKKETTFFPLKHLSSKFKVYDCYNMTYDLKQSVTVLIYENCNINQKQSVKLVFKFINKEKFEIFTLNKSAQTNQPEIKTFKQDQSNI